MGASEAARRRRRQSESVDDHEGAGTRTKKEESCQVAVRWRRNGSGRLEREYDSDGRRHARVQERSPNFREEEKGKSVGQSQNKLDHVFSFTKKMSPLTK